MANATKSTEIGPGQIKTIDLYGVTVAIANVDGHYYGFADACPHAGCSLSKGVLDGTTVTCPIDGSQFDLISGNVLKGPATTRVRTYRVQEDRGELRI